MYPSIVQVVVQHVHIDGLGRTKEDLLTYEIADVFRANNLIDVSIIYIYKYSNLNYISNCVYIYKFVTGYEEVP